jgi:rhodanese-related sulfurtransferase
MSWNSFLSNIFGSSSETDNAVATAEQNPGGARNLNLSGKAFKKELEACERPVLLDVRTAGEFSSGTIPGSQNIDFLSPNFAKNVKQLDKDATYFVFCRSGNRSAQACKIMHQLGYDVRNLSGGIGAFPF